MSPKTPTLFALAFLLTACGSTPPVHHYLLEAQAPTATALSTDLPRLGMGEITLPDYLNRPQITRRGTGGRLILSDSERWGEPLEDGFRRILAENLTRLLGDSKVALRPLPSGEEGVYRLTVDVNQFEAGPDQQVTLTAHWSLKLPNRPPLLRHSRWQIPIQGSDTTATQAAMNEALRRFALEISETLQKRP